MSRPDLNSDEKFVVAYFKSSVSRKMVGELIYDLTAAVIFGLGLRQGDRGLMFAGFCLVLGLRLYGLFYWRRYLKLIGVIFEKYEARIDELSHASSPKK